MNIATTVEQAKQTVRQWKAEGLTVGLVPTMGYLHEGHESLIKRAVAECDRVMVSVFLNPIQFASNEDLATYPRDFAADTVLIENAGADLVFHPEPSELYAPDACTFVNVEEITSELCGKTRPTHFRGVCTVVSKLMNISQADRAYFGQKDAQQLAVVRRMVRDLNMNVEVVGCPIVREEDGLAKSSRNTYLSPAEREAALVLSRAVREGHRLMEEGERDAKTILGAMRAIIEAEPLARIDYVEMVSWDGIKPVDVADSSVLVAMAVYIGKTRLIDNFIFGEYLQSPKPTKGPTTVFSNILKGKIHRATVVQAELDYVGSITVDEDLMDAAGIREYEQVQIVDVNNGQRFETYVIAGQRGSGMICLNGAAARCVSVGDKVIIMCYALMTPEEADANPPRVVFVDDDNHPERITRYERHGRLEDMDR